MAQLVEAVAASCSQEQALQTLQQLMAMWALYLALAQMQSMMGGFGWSTDRWCRPQSIRSLSLCRRHTIAVNHVNL